MGKRMKNRAVRHADAARERTARERRQAQQQRPTPPPPGPPPAAPPGEAENHECKYLGVVSRPVEAGSVLFTTHVEYEGRSLTVVAGQRAVDYALAVLRAATTAAFDAAVARQADEVLQMPRAATGQLVMRLREERQEDVADPATFPLHFAPAVVLRQRTGRMEPRVLVTLTDDEGARRLVSWRPADAHLHALQVLTVAGGVDHDSRYLRLLTEWVGVDRDTALNVVADLQSFMPDDLAQLPEEGTS